MLVDAGVDIKKELNTGQSVLQIYLKNHAMGDRSVVKYLIRTGAAYHMLGEYYFYKIRSLIMPALIADRMLILQLMQNKRSINIE
jgi:hypothetical protein